MLTRNIFYLIVACTICACSTLTQPVLDSNVDYQRDLKFEVQYWNAKKDRYTDKQKCYGLCVGKQSAKYKIKVYPEGKADMLSINSCHREDKVANPEGGGWFSSGYTFEFDAVKNLEIDRACPIELGVYEKKKGRHGWAMLVIPSNREKLSVFVQCNGKETTYGGTSVCQAKKGLLQSYVFDRKVIPATTDSCQVKPPIDGKRWIFQMPKGRCVVYFFDSMDERISHKAVWYGYDTIPIRGVK